LNINAETRLTSFFLLFEGYVQKISKINIGRENRKMENIVLSCYLGVFVNYFWSTRSGRNDIKILGFLAGFFGEFLPGIFVNQLGIFGGGFFLGVFGVFVCTNTLT
jgi:hypothetical protein